MAKTPHSSDVAEKVSWGPGAFRALEMSSLRAAF